MKTKINIKQGEYIHQFGEALQKNYFIHAQVACFVQM